LGLGMWIGFIWLMIGTSDELMWTWYWIFCFHTMQLIPYLAECTVNLSRTLLHEVIYNFYLCGNFSHKVFKNWWHLRFLWWRVWRWLSLYQIAWCYIPKDSHLCRSNPFTLDTLEIIILSMFWNSQKVSLMTATEFVTLLAKVILNSFSQ
jgi:hypothetical protein